MLIFISFGTLQSCYCFYCKEVNMDICWKFLSNKSVRMKCSTGDNVTYQCT